MLPNRVTTDRDTPSPELLVYSFIHLFMYVCPSPQKVALLHVRIGEKKVTVHGAPCRTKAYIQLGAAWFLKGIVNDSAISTPVPCSPRHDTFHFGLGRPGPR